MREREKRRRSEGEERRKSEKEKIGEGRRLARAFDNRVQFSDRGVGGVGREPSAFSLKRKRCEEERHRVKRGRVG